MPTVSCPACQASWVAAISPSRCKQCNKPLPSSASTGDLDLMLKERITCQRCKKDFYEDELKDDTRCPRCGEVALEEEEEEDGEEEPAASNPPAARGRGRAPVSRSSRPGRGRAPGRRPGGHRKKATQQPPQKKQIILTEEFKRSVFDAFKHADAASAQQLCFGLCGENEDHARQIYSHLLGVAKKNGWVGAHQRGQLPAEPIQITPVTVTPEPIHPTRPRPGEPLDPLPLPAGILSPADAAAPLPMPSGILSPQGTPPSPDIGGATLRLPPGQASGQVPVAPRTQDATALLPLGSELLPPVPPPMPEPLGLSAPSAAANAGALRDTPGEAPASDAQPGPAAVPEERGFLGRVAIEGRAAQVSLLCMAGRFAAGRDLAQSTLARDPYAPRGHAALGEALAGLGDEAQALQAYTNAVRADSSDPVCVRGYAQILTRLGRYQEAVNAYRRIVGPGKGAMKDAVALAEALRKAGDASGAQRVMDEVLKRDPQSLEPIRQRAAACAAQGDLDSAAGLLEQILAKEKPPYALALALAESMVPNSAKSSRARIACADVFIAVGRPFASVRLLLPVIARNPGDLAARRTLGLAYARLGAGPQAEEHLLGVVKRGLADADVCLALGEVYLERGETASGVKALQRARDAKPDDVDVRRALARALAAQGDLDGAIRELKAAHAASGTDDNTLEDELDRITERAFTKRIKELEARLLGDEEDSQARLQLAIALSRRGDLTEAIEHLEHVSRRRAFTAQALTKAEQIADEFDGPAPRPLVILLAGLHEANGSPERGIEVLEQHLEESHDDAEAQLVLFKTLAKCHRVQDAVAGLEAFMESATPYYLQEAAKLATDLLEKESSRALAHPLARARRQLGDLEGAATLYERLLEWEPELTDARVEYARMLEGAGRRAEAYEVLKVLVEGTTGSTAELERLATLALGAGKLEEAVALLQRAVDRHPEDLALKHALDATHARMRMAQIRKLEGTSDLDERLVLAGLYAENGNKAEAMQALRALGKLDSEDSDLSFLRFSAEHFVSQGKQDKAEAALRQVGQARGYAPGSDPHKELLYRIATLYDAASDRRGTRRVMLEIYAQDPHFKDVAARLEAISENLRGLASGGPDERILELVDVGAPLGTIFDSLQSAEMTLDPSLLSGRAQGALSRQKRPAEGAGSAPGDDVSHPIEGTRGASS